MKKLRQAVILIFLAIVIFLMANQYVFAQEIKVTDYIKSAETSDEFKKWKELSASEKESIMLPKLYKELNTTVVATNPIYQTNLLGASISSRYSLKDTILANVGIRNQYDTSSCWAFAGLSSLETNLALNNYKNGINTDKVYDFSERHANYSTTRLFANNKINEYGYNRTPASGGQWLLIENYLTSGRGAIDESAMPFENNANIVDISEIQNKKIETRLYDTIYFDDYNKQSDNDRQETMNKIKQHIQNYGSVFASIHGDSSASISYSCYNNDTGAKYCNDKNSHSTDHAVAIIGWDDNYAITNFAEGLRPSKKGAWIVRNSWGEQLEYDVQRIKEELFNTYESECKSRGWNKAADIPNSFIEAAGYKIENGKIYLTVGDNGYIYVSYEDCNVGQTLYGIEKSTDSVDYEHIYQYDELYPGNEIVFSQSSTYICNTFTKESDGVEYLTGVAITAPETYTCQVFVNPNGTGKSKIDLQPVELEAGDTETIGTGYHTLEFAKPVKITGKDFTVAVKVTGTRKGLDIVLEGKVENFPMFDYVKTEKGKCFVSSTTNLDTCTWFDLGKLEDASSTLTNGDSSIKAFTINKDEDNSLNRIEIATPPTRVVYNEGEDFDKSGLMIRAVFNNDFTTILNDSDFGIENGTNLQYGQTSVTITYMDKTVEQPITVVKKQSQGQENPGENSKEDKTKEEEQKQDEKAVSSNLANAKCTLSNIKAYYYSDSSKDYTIVDTKITGISKNSNNDSYEYYYYLSPNSDLKNITNWVKIDEKQNSNTQLEFKVDSRKIPNYDEVSKATKLYIYIKETVTKGGNQSVVVSKAILYEKGSTAIETYVDGAKKQNYQGANATSNNGSSNSGNSNNSDGKTGNNGNSNSGTNLNQSQQQKSSTASPTKLPHTGSSLLIVGIFIILVFGLIAFIRFELLNKYVK